MTIKNLLPYLIEVGKVLKSEFMSDHFCDVRLYKGARHDAWGSCGERKLHLTSRKLAKSSLTFVDEEMDQSMKDLPLICVFCLPMVPILGH